MSGRPVRKNLIGDALKILIEGGCTVERDGRKRILFGMDHQPVVEIDGKRLLAVFQDEYHQTAGVIKELEPLIAALDSKGFRVAMD